MRKTITSSTQGSVNFGSFHQNTHYENTTNVLEKKQKKWLIRLSLFAFLFCMSFAVNAQIDLNATTGTTSQSYTTLKAAFDAINAGTHTGTISISVSGNTTETATAALNSSGTGSASYSSVLIKPAASTTPTISGTINSAIIKLVGADNVTIDGSNTGGGSTRDLTITNASTGTSATGIWLGSLASNGATGNTIKNCIVQGAHRINNFIGIVSCASSSLGTASVAANSTNTYTNNAVSRFNYGIMDLGFATSPYDATVTINNNNVDSVSFAAIYLSNMSGYNVYGNTIDKVSNLSTSTNTIYGIFVTNAHLNGNIYNNKILYVRENNANVTNVSARGISLNATTTASNVTVYNNFIADISTYGFTSGLGVVGLYASTGGGYKIYHNTVNLTTNPTVTSAFPVAFAVGSGITTANSLDIRNNIFSNKQTVGNNYCFYNISGLTTLFQFLDYNNYYTTNSTLVYHNGAIGTIAAWQAASGKEANSQNVLPTFTSSSDNHLSAVNGNASLNNAGTPLAAVTTDIDGATRSSYFPDLGADEIVYIPKINDFTPTSACAGASVTITGADFTGTTAVSLAGAAAASFGVVSTSQLTAVPPSGLTSPVTGTVSVTNASGSATSINSITRLAPGTYTSKSISSGSPGDQVIIYGTNLSGATAVTFGGNSASFSITSSTEIVATVTNNFGTLAIVVTDACGNTFSAGNFSSVPPNPCAAPSTQPTSFVASSVASTTLNGSFTAASGNPSGYLVVLSTTSLTGSPSDGTDYTVGTSLGGGTVKQVSASNSVSLTGLTANTSYIITVFAYNGGGCTGGTKYNTTSPLTYSFNTCSGVPTSVTGTASVVSNANTITFNWGVPAGGSASSISYTIDVSTNSSYTAPVSGSPFTTTSLSQVVTPLNFATTYYWRIRSNNGCNSSYVTGTTTTACGAGTVLPYTQNFDAVITPNMPSCWTKEDANFDGVSWFTGVAFNAGGGNYTSPTILRYSLGNVTANDWAFSPGFQLTGGVSYTVSFDYAAYSNGENLVLKYGTTASSAGMTSGTLWSGSSLTNQTFALSQTTFTPVSSGVYYFGLFTNSTSLNVSGGTGIYLYVDNFKLQVTPPPPTAPSGLGLTPSSTSIAATWTDNSSNEDGFNIYTSTDGTNYSFVTYVGSNVTNYTITNLNALTQYYVKVTSFNAGGESATGATGSTTTLSCGGVYTTNSWVGTLVAGQVHNWNSGSNWSLGHAPNSCEDVVISPTLPITTTAYIYQNANTSIHNLTISATNTGTALQRLFVWTQGFTFNVSGDVTVTSNRTANTGVTGDNIYLVSGPGIMTINGNVNIGTSGNRAASLGAGGASLGPIYFRGSNITFGDQAFLNFGTLINFTFDAPGAQTVNVNSSITSASPDTYGFGAVTIGSTNTPTVTITDTMSTTSQLSRVVNDMTISNGSTLIIDNGASLNRTVNGGTLTMGANSTLKLLGATGGEGNSNFPSNFSTKTVDPSSTIEYNASAAQQVAATLVYGNLKVNNSNGVSLVGNTSADGNLILTDGKVNTGTYALTLGLNSSVSGAGSSRYVIGKLGKTIGNATSSKTFEIGDATNYLPTSVTFNGGSTNSGGVFTMGSVTGAHAALGFTRSGISTTNYLNKYFTMSNSGITGFTTISPTFTYDAGEIVGGGNNSNFKAADSLSGGGWTIRNTNNSTSTSSTITSMAYASGSASEVVIGEEAPVPAPTVDDPSPATACEGTSYFVTGTNFYAISSVKIGTVEASFTVTSPTSITITIPVGAAPGGTLSVTNNGGTATSITSLTVKPQPQTTVGISSQTICSGGTISTITIGNSGNLPSTTYSWTRNDASGGTGTIGLTGTTDISGTLVSTSTIDIHELFSVVATTNGCVGTTAVADVIVKPSPGTVVVSPTIVNICQTAAQPLTATVTAATGSSTANSGVVNLAIPDNNVAGVNTTLAINNIPSGVVITKIAAKFSINHTYNGDLVINLTAPNGKTINLANLVGDAGDGFLDAICSSDGVDAWPVDSVNNITGTYAADMANGVGSVAYPSNALSWSQLYTTPNGTWRLSVRDRFAGDAGAITNFQLTIYYTLSPTLTWTPQPGLFTDAGFTSYTGQSLTTVYAKNSPGTYYHNAKISFGGCNTTSDTVHVSVDANPVATRTPVTQTICSGDNISDIMFGTSNGVIGTTFDWTRDNTGSITGISSSGTGSITGAMSNTTATPVTVTFTATPTGPGATACPGNAVTSTVVVNPRPIATATPSSQNACSGSPITTIVLGTSNNLAGTSYAWTRDNTSAATGIAASGTSSISGALTNASTPTTVTFTVNPTGPLSAGSCTGTPVIATVAVYNLPTSYSVTGGGTYCAPGTPPSVGLSNSQTGYSYQLMLNGSPVGTAIPGSTGTPLDFGTQATGGTYTVVASNTGCTYTMSGNAVVVSYNTVTPSVTISASATTICTGSNVTFSAIATNGGPSPIYNFYVDGSLKQSGVNNGYVTNTLTNGSVVNCTMTSNNTCQTTNTSTSGNIVMTVNPGSTPPAPAAIGGATKQCTIGAYNYVTCATTGGVWSSTNPSVATVSNAPAGKVTAVANGTTIISYTVSGGGGCTNSSSVVYTVAQQDAPSAISGPLNLCQFASATLTSSPSGGVWSSVNNAASVVANTGVVTGTYGGGSVPATIKYTLTNSAGCTAYVSKNITINAIPAQPSFGYASGTVNPQNGAGGASNFCINKTFTLVGSPTGGTWSTSNSAIASVTVGGVVSTLALGSVSISYTVTNAQGCSRSKTISGNIVNCVGSRGVEIKAETPRLDFTLFPNPAKTSVEFNVQLVEAGGKVVVNDMFGREVKQQALSLGTNKIDISNLSTGFYIVNVITAQGKVSKKLSVE